MSNPSDKASIPGNLDPDQIVRRQIDRCNVALTNGDEIAFGNAVRALLAMIPTEKRKEVEKERTEYEKSEPKLKYQYYCGAPMGTPEHPIMRNGEPWSPVTVEEVVTDHYKLYSLIMQKIEDSDLSWGKKPKEG